MAEQGRRSLAASHAIPPGTGTHAHLVVALHDLHGLALALGGSLGTQAHVSESRDRLGCVLLLGSGR